MRLGIQGFWVALVGLFMIAVPDSGAAEPNAGLNASEQGQVDKVLAPLREASTAAAKRTTDRIARYASELAEAEKRVTARGKLDEILKLRTERVAWIAGERTPTPAKDDRAVPSELRSLRQALDGDLASIERSNASDIERARTRTLPALKQLESAMTRASRIDAAVAVRETIDKIEKDEVLPGGPPMAASEATPPTTRTGPGTSNLSSATKSSPFVNSLGMKFVPVPKTKVLFCIWETRVKDFDAFVKDSGYSWSETAPFHQTPEDPVVRASWNDAQAFCDWLSKREGRNYRLPTDEEWDAAAGKEEFSWGKEWPPPKGAGNFAGDESKLGLPEDPKEQDMIKGRRDDHPRTSPVGSYKPSKSGLYDLSGNVWEWCEDWYTEAIYKKHKEGGGPDFNKPDEIADIKNGNVRKVIRGGSWDHAGRSALRCSARPPHTPDTRHNYNGFRCVVETLP